MHIFSLLHQALAQYLRLFFLLTPFFVLGTFISLTKDIPTKLRSQLSVRIAIGAASVTLIIYLAGELIMKVFGITVEAFRAGSGVLLLLTAITLVLGKNEVNMTTKAEQLLDMAVVPLAVPITAGPATLGTLMVMGVTTHGICLHAVTILAIIMACASIGIMLFFSDKIEKLLGRANINILSKITGLILSAIAVQMMVVGVRGIWGL